MHVESLGVRSPLEALEAIAPSVAINDRCQIRTQGDHRVVMVSGIVLTHYTTADRMAEASAMVSPVEQGWANQNDVAGAFGYSARTLRRDQRRYEAGGRFDQF
jgi:hypothetical protein